MWAGLGSQFAQRSPLGPARPPGVTAAQGHDQRWHGGGAQAALYSRNKVRATYVTLNFLGTTLKKLKTKTGKILIIYLVQNIQNVILLIYIRYKESY